MIRKIVNIDENKCNGCGICVTACHEGAIELIDGKAELVSDIYCDGLGDCLPGCPTEAITIIERESLPYDDGAVQERMKFIKNEITKPEDIPCGCPGTIAKTIDRSQSEADKEASRINEKGDNKCSELQQWPIQLKLVNSNAAYLKNADLLIAADCTAYAYGSFHKDFIKGKIVLIGCPKLDDVKYYKEKIQEIFKNNNIKSVTVVRMKVPCCSGIAAAIKQAMLDAQIILPYNEVIIDTNGVV